MAKTNYILTYQGEPKAIISIDNEKDFKDKISLAIKEEVCAEKDAQFELQIGRLGDWGEKTNIKTKYVQDGLLITDEEFSIIKSITY